MKVVGWDCNVFWIILGQSFLQANGRVGWLHQSHKLRYQNGLFHSHTILILYHKYEVFSGEVCWLIARHNFQWFFITLKMVYLWYKCEMQSNFPSSTRKTFDRLYLDMYRKFTWVFITTGELYSQNPWAWDKMRCNISSGSFGAGILQGQRLCGIPV